MQPLQTVLFENISEEEWSTLEKEARVRRTLFQKGERIFRCGETTDEIGTVLSGELRVENTDIFGNRSLIGALLPGEIFGESYAVGRVPLQVDVVASRASEILFIHLPAALRGDPFRFSWQRQLLWNLTRIAAQKNRILSTRIFCTGAKTIRERVITYLSGIAKQTGYRVFEIPLNRQELADYLNVDRSALSKELSKMRRDGLIDYDRNCFRILSAADSSVSQNSSHR